MSWSPAAVWKEKKLHWFSERKSNIKMKSQRNNKNVQLERKIQRKKTKCKTWRRLAWTLIGDRKVSEGKSLCHSMLFADLWPIVQWQTCLSPIMFSRFCIKCCFFLSFFFKSPLERKTEQAAASPGKLMCMCVHALFAYINIHSPILFLPLILIKFAGYINI